MCETPTACKRMVSGSISLPCAGYFSPFPHGTGPLSVSQEYLALPDGAGQFTQDFSSPALLRILARTKLLFHVPGCHRLWHTFPGISIKVFCLLCKSFNPDLAATKPVWAVPRSLATTCGITIVFFSYGYLDVSVPHVRIPVARNNAALRHWVAPFGNLRINAYLQLPEAYRSLSRPSSPLRAKASTIRSYSLLYCIVLEKTNSSSKT